MEEHDELGVHGDADVVRELRHHAALHFGFAVGVWGGPKEEKKENKTMRDETIPRFSYSDSIDTTPPRYLRERARRGPAREWT